MLYCYVWACLTLLLLSIADVHSRSVKARAHKGPVKVVYLLGADDYNEADVPADAFVIYQVRLSSRPICPVFLQSPASAELLGFVKGGAR
jgi:hypothetical protein